MQKEEAEEKAKSENEVPEDTLLHDGEENIGASAVASNETEMTKEEYSNLNLVTEICDQHTDDMHEFGKSSEENMLVEKHDQDLPTNLHEGVPKNLERNVNEFTDYNICKKQTDTKVSNVLPMFDTKNHELLPQTPMELGDSSNQKLKILDNLQASLSASISTSITMDECTEVQRMSLVTSQTPVEMQHVTVS